jgi:hypothetical protein
MTRSAKTLTARSLVSLVLVLAVTSVAGAQQKKISGVSHCGKPNKQETIAVGDRPDHAFGISRVKCTWTKPLEVAGLTTTEDEVTGFSEVMGGRATERIYVVGNMSNGDKMFVRGGGTATLKDGAPQSSAGEWAYTGGAGKLAGIKGKGTYKCTWGADGTATCDVQGHYTIPKGPKP